MSVFFSYRDVLKKPSIWMIYTCKIGSQHLIFSLQRNIPRNPIPELQFIIERDKKNDY